MRRKSPPSSIEIQFTETPDGLLVGPVILRPGSAAAEGDLRAFLARMRLRDLDVDLEGRALLEEAE